MVGSMELASWEAPVIVPEEEEEEEEAAREVGPMPIRCALATVTSRAWGRVRRMGRGSKAQ